MTHFAISCLAALLIAAGCGSSTTDRSGKDTTANTEAAPSDPEPAAPAETKESTAEPSAQPEPSHVVGRWQNSSCGDRQYPRKVSFNLNGSFVGSDEVAPCPPGALCTWSGIESWSGEWTLEGRLIRLEYSTDPPNPHPERLPEGFELLPGEEFVVAERNGDVVCPYQRR
jgi:hypothetical protein